MAIIGFATESRYEAPYHDPECEIWGLNMCESWMLLEADVGLAQLPLTRSEFIGERLRLLQQFFCPRHRGDRIEDDADALGELIQERQLDLREAVERGELDHCFDVVLE